jgi:hypothetical protein
VIQSDVPVLPNIGSKLAERIDCLIVVAAGREQMVAQDVVLGRRVGHDPGIREQVQIETPVKVEDTGVPPAR